MILDSGIRFGRILDVSEIEYLLQTVESVVNAILYAVPIWGGFRQNKTAISCAVISGEDCF